MWSFYSIRKPIQMGFENISCRYISRLNWLNPDLLSYFNLVFSGIAGFAFYRHSFVIATIALFLAFVSDSFDGILARSQQNTSSKGYFLDSSIDRIGEAFWFVGIYFSNIIAQPLVFILVIASLLSNYLRVNISRSFDLDVTGLIEKGERNIYFLIISFIMIFTAASPSIIISFWVISILSIITVIQLFVFGIKLPVKLSHTDDPDETSLETSVYSTSYLTGMST